MASNGSPSRKMCSPAWKGPTCSTSTCRSISERLSMPSARQACENAQVEQKLSVSPSSDSVLASLRGKATWFTQGSMCDSAWTGSDRAREARCGNGGGLLEIAVEAHGDVTQEQPPARGDRDPARLDPDQAVLGQGPQLFERLGEVLGEIDPVAPLKRAYRHLALAYQLLDQVRAQLVVLIQAHAAEYRQPAFVERNLPARQVARVLAEAVADVADRAHAQADEVAVGVGGVAHEVAMQAAARLRDREIVVGQCEMIHADVHVARGGQFRDRQLQQHEFGFRVRQVVGIELPLWLEQLRHVRIAVHRDAVGPHVRDDVEC